MTHSLISNMAAVSETLLASLLVLFIGVSGFPLDKEAKQSRSCGYEVSFVCICSLSYLLKLVNGALAQVFYDLRSPLLPLLQSFSLLNFCFLGLLFGSKKIKETLHKSV